MFETIVVTTDFSANSAVALPPAVEIARAFGARIVLIHALEGSGPEPAGPEAPGPATAAALAAMTKEQLEEFGARHIGDRAAWTAEVVFGPAYTAIADAARRHRAGLVALATHGRTGLSHLLLGSVAERVLRIAPCPVLTVRGEAD